MRLRPRPDPSVYSTAERVRALFAPAAAGWLPPPDPRGGPDDGGHETDGPALARVVPRRDDQDGPDADGLDLEAERGNELHPSDRSWSGPDESPRRSRSASSAHRWRSARLDPGRRGAVALVVAALLAALLAVAVVLAGRPREVTVPDTSGGPAVPEVVATGVPLPGGGAAGPSAAAAASSEVVVAVAGEVRRPGLVRLPAGSRVDDAVRAAGGPLPGTHAGLLNLARRLVDGEQVLVGVEPPPGGAPVAGAPPAAGGAAPAAAAGPLDLNAATVGELDALPGIGPVLAQRIVDWRTEHGSFLSVEQLREVTGIGESKYADLQDRVRVS